MFKKKIYIIFLLIIIILGFIYFVFYKMPDNTIKEVLNDYSPVSSIEIIHQENIQSNILIFYTHKDEKNNDVLFAYVKRRFGEYKIVNSGYYGNVFNQYKKEGLYYNYIGNYNKSPFPIIWGIAPKTIDDINIIESNSDKIIDAKIIKKQDFILWFASIDDVDKVKFIGSNKEKNKIIIAKILDI
jgi:hypothetical protein